MGEIIKAYKGFNKDMTCRDFQYEEGKEYEEPSVEICDHGFHACEYPLDCLGYYAPNKSVYHEVEQFGEIQKQSDDSKVASTKIKIGAEISITGLVKAAIEYTTKRTRKESDNDDQSGASSATGYKGASSATGDHGASSATGYKGASSATGDYGASSVTGYCGASSATGYCGSAEAGDSDSVAVAWGYHGKAKGVLGSHLVLADWEGNEKNYWTQNEWKFKCAKMVRVDGENIKPDTWYTMKDGEIVEVEESEE